MPPPPNAKKTGLSSTVHLTQESIRLNGRQIIVKVVYTDNGSSLTFTAWDPMTSRVIRPTTCAALYCDQLTNYSPVELEAMPESFRRQKLRTLIDNITIGEDPTNSNVSRLSIFIDRLIVSGKRTIEGNLHEVRSGDADSSVRSVAAADPAASFARRSTKFTAPRTTTAWWCPFRGSSTTPRTTSPGTSRFLLRLPCKSPTTSSSSCSPISPACTCAVSGSGLPRGRFATG